MKEIGLLFCHLIHNIPGNNPAFYSSPLGKLVWNMKLAIHFHLTEIYPHTSVHLHCVTLSQRAAVSIRNTVVLDDQYEKHHVLI
jgi:hypothetical protein